MKRCSWCNPNNRLYVQYHDEEWGQLNTDERYLLEMLILESFQAGLSWECVLNKREAFLEAYDGFDLDRICAYDEKKIAELLENKGIIRNRLKIVSSIGNARIFKEIQKQYGSFCRYLEQFTEGKIIRECGKTTNEISDRISEDLYKRGMRFVGSVIIYSYLQAVGIIDSHEEGCFLYKQNKGEKI
ncbi:MAG: DNA-3-methyladenine glycosylase I [Erysipelotrichaceae bacterium]|nr:DNA-3-methyladenine glycosylase I [Erysipelotrichaceae bacterium]